MLRDNAWTTKETGLLAFTVDEFAEAFRLSRATVYNMWKAGQGPSRMRVRGRVLISRAAADHWRKQLESQPGAA